MQNIYKLVDEIYCINLITRNDRYETMNQFASSENIKITYFRPERHPKEFMFSPYFIMNVIVTVFFFYNFILNHFSFLLVFQVE